MKTGLCDLLNIEKPILSAPMAGVSGAPLVAAVSEAGGMGVIPLWSGPAEYVRPGIAAVRAQTDRPFAVNLNLSFPFEEQLQTCIEEEVPAVSLFWGENPAAVETAKKGGLTVLFSVGSADEARRAVDAGADVIVAQGWEAGGHVWGKVTTLALVPAVVDAVDVPVIAAGGIADGRGLAAALMLGASGAWVGTRFLAAEETDTNETYLRLILEASENQTEWAHDLYDVKWPDAPHRALSNSTSAAWIAAGRPAPGDRPGEGKVIGERPDGGPVVKYQSHSPSTGTKGEVEAMSLWSGQGVSLVREVMPAARIVDEIIGDAEKLLQSAGRFAR